MRVSEIQQKIEENRAEVKSMQNRITKLMAENKALNNQRDNKLISYFHDYIELGSKYNIKSWCFFTGVQTGIKKNESGINPEFRNGDVIEFIKKNNKSIIIKCITKVNRNNTKGLISYSTEYPNTTFRVDTISLYNFLLKDPNFREPYNKYVTRIESLDILGI